MTLPGSACEQVGYAMPKLSRRTAGEEKTYPSFLDQAVHFIQKLRKLLDFINHHDPGAFSQFLFDRLRTPQKLVKHLIIEKIVDLRFRQRLADQKTLTHSPWAKEEHRILSQELLEIQGALESLHLPRLANRSSIGNELPIETINRQLIAD